MIDLVLENNYFQCGRNNYYADWRHINWNKKSPCTIHVQYMGSCESQLINEGVQKSEIYLRYVDDIFGIWPHGDEALKEFHQKASLIHAPKNTDHIGVFPGIQCIP